MSKYKYEKKDFIYVIAIFLITLIFVIGNFYWRTESSGITLNNVATGISIVLAVVAIVITLVDVAGQRNGILEIKDTAEKLEELQRESYNLYKKLSIDIQKIDSLKETLQETVETSKAIKLDISDAITQLRNENPDENIDSVLQKLEDIKSRLNEKEIEASEIASTLTVTKNPDISAKTVATIEQFIKDRYPTEYRMTIEDFIKEVSDKLKYSRITVLQSIQKLEQEKKVQTYKDLLDVNISKRFPWQ